MKKIIEVPLEELRPGDTLKFPDAKVTSASDIVRFDFPSGTSGIESVSWLEKNGATATREEVEPEFNLTWEDAVVAMFRGNGSVVCEDDSFGARYRICKGQLQEFLQWGWEDVACVKESFYCVKWRIVEEKQNGN